MNTNSQLTVKKQSVSRFDNSGSFATIVVTMNNQATIVVTMNNQATIVVTM